MQHIPNLVGNHYLKDHRYGAATVVPREYRNIFDTSEVSIVHDLDQRKV